MTQSLNESAALKMRISAWGLVMAGGVVASVATTFGFLGDWWWFFDLFAHFRMQYLFGLSVLAVIFLIRRKFKAAVIFGGLALVNLCVVAPLYMGGIPPPALASPTQRAMLMNVNTETGKPEKVAAAIQEFNPDFVVLEEVNEKWLADLGPVLKAYPHSRVRPREDNFGIALFSKHPITQGGIRELGAAELPSVMVELASPAGRFTVIATHPLPPGNAENTRLRDDQLMRLPEIIKEAPSPVFLIGDLNATPWCEIFKQIGLRDSAQGRGVQPSWPTHIPIFWIPIDHCLHAPEIFITGRMIGPNVGSDHYPLIVDFVMAAPVPAGRR